MVESDLQSLCDSEICPGLLSPSPLEETVLDLSIYRFQISFSYVVPLGLHTSEPGHTDEGMYGHAS